MTKQIDLTTILPTDHTNVAAELSFKFHSDAGHGWLAVKICLVRELGLASDISCFSYMQGKTAYLEEDCDTHKFIKAFTEKFGFAPVIKELQSKNRSPIRSFNRFKMEA